MYDLVHAAVHLAVDQLARWRVSGDLSLFCFEFIQ